MVTYATRLTCSGELEITNPNWTNQLYTLFRVNRKLWIKPELTEKVYTERCATIDPDLNQSFQSLSAPPEYTDVNDDPFSSTPRILKGNQPSWLSLLEFNHMKRQFNHMNLGKGSKILCMP
ncbi:hypothetical protein DPX16_6269 [Anabarilius grahami]|uniref:Uncharacterized protein n=1 Tax=Anabarilius grahami TaxID=495550 RepID=A0A3N0YJ14_ANAGA|nr:hypothetical protein DPX16_6269 [Anabarilius grahami]